MEIWDSAKKEHKKYVSVEAFRFYGIVRELNSAARDLTKGTPHKTQNTVPYLLAMDMVWELGYGSVEEFLQTTEGLNDA